jgi:hypothetical protein
MSIMHLNIFTTRRSAHLSRIPVAVALFTEQTVADCIPRSNSTRQAHEEAVQTKHNQSANIGTSRSPAGVPRSGVSGHVRLNCL